MPSSRREYRPPDGAEMTMADPNDRTVPLPSAALASDGDGRDRRKDSLVRLPAVRARTGLSTPTIYRRQAAGTFPKSVKIGLNAIAWYESDIDDFVAAPISYRAV